MTTINNHGVILITNTSGSITPIKLDVNLKTLTFDSYTPDLTSMNGGLLDIAILRYIEVNPEIANSGLNVEFRINVRRIDGSATFAVRNFAAGTDKNNGGWFSLADGKIEIPFLLFASNEQPISSEISDITSISIRFNKDVAKKACCCKEPINVVMNCGTDFDCTGITCSTSSSLPPDSTSGSLPPDSTSGSLPPDSTSGSLPSSSSTTPTSSKTSGADSSSDLSTGAIVGIVLAVMVFILMIIIIVVVAYQSQKASVNQYSKLQDFTLYSKTVE